MNIVSQLQIFPKTTEISDYKVLQCNVHTYISEILCHVFRLKSF